MDAGEQENYKVFERLFQSAPDAIIVSGEDGRIRQVNGQAETTFGYRSEELHGNPIEMLIPERAREPHVAFRKRYQANPRTRPLGTGLELYGRRRDGTEFPADILLSQVHSADGSLVIAVVRDITERRRLEEALRDRNREKVRGLSRRLVAMEEAERRKINRELHDRIGQNLAALNLNLNLVRSKLSPRSARAAAAQLEQTQMLLEETTARIRDVMADLHPPALDDYGLFAALRTLVETLSLRVGLPIVLLGKDVVPRLPQEVEMALFRIAQGAIANAVSHARAKHIRVVVAEIGERVTLTIADDGEGFDPDGVQRGSAKWGLTVMRERAEAVGARFRIESAPGRGTSVTVEAPREER